MLQMALRMAIRHGGRIVRGADHKGAGQVGTIGDGHVDHGWRFFAEIDGTDVADDADDLDGFFAGIAAGKELADGILTVPCDLRCMLGDDGDVLAAIVVGEDTAGDERDVHGFEVAGTEPAEARGGTREEGTRVGGNGDEIAPAVAIERKHADNGGGADSGQLAEAFERALIEGFAGGGRAVLLVRQHDAGADDVLGGEAAIDAQQAIEAEQEHAGKDDECDAGRNLTDDEGTTQLFAAGRFAGGAAFGHAAPAGDGCA